MTILKIHSKYAKSEEQENLELQTKKETNLPNVQHSNDQSYPKYFQK